MAKEICGSYHIQYHPVEGDPEKVFEIDFTPPFKRVYMIPELENKLGINFPSPAEFHTPGFYACASVQCICVIINITFICA